jgi:hypothetical protein
MSPRWGTAIVLLFYRPAGFGDSQHPVGPAGRSLMQYEASLARPSARTMLAPLVALVIGAAAATGTYALIDNGDDAIQAATRVIVVETPAQHSADIPGKNEAATAAAINPTLSVAGPDEASTAAAVSQSSVTAPRGSKAATAGPDEASTAAAVSQSSVTAPLGSASP